MQNGILIEVKKQEPQVAYPPLIPPLTYTLIWKSKVAAKTL